jgi:hypothetical protein
MNKKEQNFKNHAQSVFGYHRLGATGMFLLIIGSFVNLYRSQSENLYSASLICMMSLLLLLVASYARTFPLRAQDRAIRAEENLRYYVMTGKLLPQALTVSQIVALRFASDEEFPALVDRAVKEQLRSKEIKSAIKNWRADHYRV